MESFTLQEEYIKGLNYLRELINNVEIELEKEKREFYCCEENNEENYEYYLKECNEDLIYCIMKLRKYDIDLQVVDSAVSLVSLLTDVRKIPENLDQHVLSFLTQFWEHLKLSLESLQILRQKFQRQILRKLSTNCQSYKHSTDAPAVATQYANLVSEYENTINSLLHQSEELTRGFQVQIPQDLFSDTNFSKRVLICCDQKAFPVLRLLPDLTEKMEVICRVAKQWLDKDELYVRDVGNYIRDTRSETLKKTDDLRSSQERKSQVTEAVDEAYTVCCNNKAILQKLETNLQELEYQSESCAKRKRSKSEEKRQKEGMVGFLAISMKQTKKNYGIQMKRSSLMKQVRNLEQNLDELETELTTIKRDMKSKSDEKVIVVEKVNESNNTYVQLKSDLEKLVEYVEKLQQEVNDLTDSLGQLEVIQATKTSQENMEELYEKSSKVQLAPSLKQKILRKRKNLNNST